MRLLPPSLMLACGIVCLHADETGLTLEFERLAGDVIDLSWQPAAGTQYGVEQSFDMLNWANVGVYGSGESSGQHLAHLRYPRQFFRLVGAENPLYASLQHYHSFDQDAGDVLQSDLPAGTSLLAEDGVVPDVGLFGSSAHFSDVARQALKASDGSEFSTAGDSFFVSFWMYKDTGATTQAVLEKPGEYLIYESSGKLQFRVKRKTTGTATVSALGGALAAGKWYHVLAWFDFNRNSLNLRVDGGEVATEQNPHGVAVSTNCLTLGYGNVSAATQRNWFNGRIDEFCLAQRAPDSYEADVLFSGGAGARFPFERPVLSPRALLEAEITSDAAADVTLIDHAQGGSVVGNSIIGQGRGYQKSLQQYDEVASAEHFRPEGSFSIAFWSRLTSEDAAMHPILGKAEAGKPREYAFFRKPDAAGVDLGLLAGDVRLEAPCAGDCGKWIHLALTFDESTGEATLYSQGNEADSAILASAFNPSASRFSIGRAQLVPGDSGLALEDYFDGMIDELRFYRRSLEDHEVRTLFLAGRAVACWGDSFTAGPGAVPYAEQLALLRGTEVSNHGFFGASPDFLKNQMARNHVETARVTVIWVGWTIHANPISLQTVEPALASMVQQLEAMRADARYVILNLANHHHPDWESHGDRHPDEIRANLAPVNAMIAANYPDNYIDLDHHFIHDFVAQSADDLADQAGGIIPRSLRINQLDGDANFNDDTHLTTQGYGEIAELLNAFFDARGW